jgi:hypothetical protein
MMVFCYTQVQTKNDTRGSPAEAMVFSIYHISTSNAYAAVYISTLTTCFGYRLCLGILCLHFCFEKKQQHESSMATELFNQWINTFYFKVEDKECHDSLKTQRPFLDFTTACTQHFVASLLNYY